nr:PREDICTED: uncharacterized protein LOC105674166 [Linepithema humile]
MTTGEIMAQYRFLVLSIGALLDASTDVILEKYWDDRIGPRLELQYYFGTEFQYCCSTDFHYCYGTDFHYCYGIKSVPILNITWFEGRANCPVEYRGSEYWAILSEKRNQASRVKDASTSDSVREDMDESADSEGDATVQERRPETGPLRSEESDDHVSRELALVQRERELIERERQLLQREREMARSVSASSNAASASGGVRNLKDLLPEFDATENTFWRWKHQLELLRNSYQLDDNSARILISSRLRGRALTWFYSKAEHLMLSIEDLLGEMTRMFDLRPGKLSLRKEFEARAWKTAEPFCDYYHDKIILANRVPIDEDELLDYLIEGITDIRLQNQARIMNFKSKTMLLEAFENVSLENKRYSDPKLKKTGPQSSAKTESAKAKPTRCYKCRETGHIATHCKNPLSAEKRTCFVCGSTEHLARSCPERKQATVSEVKEKSAQSTSTNIIEMEQNSELPRPYLINVKISSSNKNDSVDTFTIDAIIDSGSPISLVRDSVVSAASCNPVNEDTSRFCGINGSRLKILRIFYGNVEVQSVCTKIKFYTVPDDTIAFRMLLGRDFLACPSLRITLGDTVEIESVCESNSEQVLNIALKKHEPDFEMNIVLKHDQPITSRPRRLSFADKEVLQKILDRLIKENIIRPSNSAYASPIVLHGIRPSDENIESVLNYPVPRNAGEVRRFVGLASYFRRFVPNFSLLAKPLYDLNKKDASFAFGVAEHEAFETLKRHLASRPVLAIYSPHADTELHCDASASGYGGILLQKQSEGAWKPISFWSQRTTPTEAKYHSYELECLAVVYALKRFHIYLAGQKFKIVTDCDSFRLTLNKKDINPRISRWALFLQNYNYEIEHRPGKRMAHVDALSRCHSVLVLEGSTFERTLSICQDRDAEILKIRERLEEGEVKHYELRDGLVYRKDNDKKLLFFVYWFPRLREKVKEHIANCLRCIEFSPISGKAEGFLHNVPKEKLPFMTIHIDHLGPLEKTAKNYRHILIIIDAFTKFTRTYPCKSTTTDESIKCLRDYFRAYSKPKRLISDRVSTPRANGQVERFNRTIAPMLAKLSETPSKWDRVLNDVEYSLNNTVCRATGKTPSQLLFGVDQKGKANDSLREILNPDVNRDLEEIRNHASANIEALQLQNEKRYNLRRKAAREYKVGDYIEIRNIETTPGINKKLLPKFKGPYIVKAVLDHDRYVVSDIDGFHLTQRPYTSIVAPDQMRPYIHS